MELDQKTREFLASHDHRYHALGDYPGGMSDPIHSKYNPLARQRAIGCLCTPSGISRAYVDQAWVVMLYKQNLIDGKTAKNLLIAIEEAKKEPTYRGENWLKEFLGGDEDTASAVNLGRTLQEPMSRLHLRIILNDFFDKALDCLEKILNFAYERRDLIMPGHTHMSQAQPTTYGAYMVAIYDGLVRCIEQLELAYRQNNLCSAGCGALSGSGWPIDRYYVAKLLGFDDIVGSCLDSEAGQDYATTVLFALTNMMLIMTRTTMDHEVWGLEEVGHFTVDGVVAGPSSLMPQKAHPCGELEMIRAHANDVLTAMYRGVLALHGEPYEDILPIYQAWNSAESALYSAMHTLLLFVGYLPHMHFNKERMLENVRSGYSCMPDLAIYLIKEKGIGGRRAHRMCATTTFLARRRGIKGYEITAELFNEALELNKEEVRDILTTKEIQEYLDPVKFIERHNNIGDPNPNEVARQITQRREVLNGLKNRHNERLEKLKQAQDTLNSESKAIIDNN
ncbi:MAG: lyase family protein [Acutalibacteraceae bacterium]|jgi:argininosuccinate lyase